jgi:hypothetical protein
MKLFLKKHISLLALVVASTACFFHVFSLRGTHLFAGSGKKRRRLFLFLLMFICFGTLFYEPKPLRGVNQSIFTVSVWVKPSGSVASKAILGKAEELRVATNASGQPLCQIKSSSTWQTAATSSVAISVGNWAHIACAYDLAYLRVYVNGVETGSQALSVAADDTSAVWKIGRDDSASTPYGYFAGQVDEYKFYNFALTPDQIALDMNQGKAVQFGGESSATGATGQAAEYCVPGDTSYCAPPVAEWKFDEKTGTTANDTSGNGNVGTWYGTGNHWDRGKNGSAGKFNYPSSNDYVKITSLNGTSFYQKGTLSFWFNIKDNAGWSNYNGLFHTRDTNGLSDWFGIDKSGTGNPSALRVEFGNSGGSITTTYTNNTFDSSSGWKYLTVTWDQTTNQRSIYVDSILDNTTSVSTWPSIFQNIVIGNDRGMTARSFNGLIDGMVLYNYVRTPAQIAWDYNRGKPVGWWKLDEGEGISAYDSSGNGNTGTLTNLDPPNDWVDGKFGKALDFDGSDDYVETSASTIFDVGTTVSMTAWIKRDTNSHNWESIANHIKKTSSYDGYWIGSIANGKIRAFVGPYTNYVDTTNAVSNSVWHHVALVSNGTIFSIYVDGVKASADQAVGAISTTNVSVRIGRSIAAGEYFDGQIDDVRIYNYALTAEQIKQIMNEGSAIRFGE